MFNNNLHINIDIKVVHLMSTLVYALAVITTKYRNYVRTLSLENLI